MNAAMSAEAGAAAWRSALGAQRSASAGHGDFYALAGELVETLRALRQLAEVLGMQVAGYGVERELYDDVGGDPAARLEEAVGHLEELREALAPAERRAQGFWSAIGHIGVRLDDEAPGADR